MDNNQAITGLVDGALQRYKEDIEEAIGLLEKICFDMGKIQDDLKNIEEYRNSIFEAINKIKEILK